MSEALRSPILTKRLALFQDLLRQWDDLVTRLTNKPITNEDLWDIILVWRESESRFEINCIRFVPIGPDGTRNKIGDIMFSSSKILEQFANGTMSDRNELHLERLKEHPYTLTIQF